MPSYGDIGPRAAAYSAAEMLRHAGPYLKLSAVWPWWKRWLYRLGFIKWEPQGPTIKTEPGQTLKFRRPIALKETPMSKLLTINLCTIHNGIIIEASHNGSKDNPFGAKKTIYAADLGDAASRLEALALELCADSGRDADPIHRPYRPAINAGVQLDEVRDRLARPKPTSRGE